VARLGIVRPGSFVPPPKVDSAFVGFRLQPPPLAEQEMPEFERLLRAAFSQRRKTLLNSFARTFSRAEVEAALSAHGLDIQTRAEALTMADFLALFRTLTGAGREGFEPPGGILSGIGNPTKP
jgi:16S rRNA (adenine1518-N6/adenine1519-N6)-dimethyltransferase